jgi:hypothetical protein
MMTERPRARGDNSLHRPVATAATNPGRRDLLGSSNLDSDRRFNSDEELRASFKAAGLKGGLEVGAHRGGATLDVLALPRSASQLPSPSGSFSAPIRAGSCELGQTERAGLGIGFALRRAVIARLSVVVSTPPTRARDPARGRP